MKTSGNTAAPKALPVVPNARQLAWHELEFYGFIHFTINAWTDREWGFGDESPSLFNPEKLDCAQWAQAAKDGGMKGLILTAKHHDGFCLFPSKHTEHCVRNSPWRKGKGDVVREFVDACRAAKLKVGLYLSPWDRNRADYGRPGYIDYYRKQVAELLGGEYGELFEFWLDGANGGDGFYGGARETRKIDAKTYYDWGNTLPFVREHQPDATIFSLGDPDIRWVGNERGEASETCWQTFSGLEDDYPECDKEFFLAPGHFHGDSWRPPECDVSIRPGWFHHDSEDSKVKSPKQLLDLYFKSVGRGASFLLNLPPARNGLIHENDVASLLEFRKMLDAGYAKDFAKGAKASASDERGPEFSAAKAIDGDPSSYWATKDGTTNASLTLELKRPAKMNTVNIRENIALGQRVMAFKVEGRRGDEWRLLACGTSVGPRRLLKFQAEELSALRLTILDAKACPCVKELSAHLFG